MIERVDQVPDLDRASLLGGFLELCEDVGERPFFFSRAEFSTADERFLI